MLIINVDKPIVKPEPQRIYVRDKMQYSKSMLALQTACVLFLIVFMEFSLAAPQLMVTPTRVVFDGNSRTAQVTVINTGDDSGTYRISVVNKRMTVDGQFEDVKNPIEGELFADKMIRYSPRQVRLEPGKSQVVRLSLRKPSKLSAGEYRSHLLFKAIPKSTGGDIESLSRNDNITIQLTAIVSISIPVIVRHGKTDASITFSDIQLKPANQQQALPMLQMELVRDGNQSVYGDILTEFVQENGASNILAQVNGVAVYSPNKKRKFALSLKVPPGLELKNGIIKIYYRHPTDQGGKVMAQTQLKLP